MISIFFYGFHNCHRFKYDISTNILTFMDNVSIKYSYSIPTIYIQDMNPKIDLSDKEQMLYLISKRMEEIIYEKL